MCRPSYCVDQKHFYFEKRGQLCFKITAHQKMTQSHIVHCHNSLQLVDTLHQINPVHTHTSSFFKINSNIILKSSIPCICYIKVHRLLHQDIVFIWCNEVYLAILSSILNLFFHVVSFRFSYQNTVCISLYSHTYYMLHQAHPPGYDHSNNICKTEQITELLIMQFFPACCYFLPLQSQYSPQHPVLKDP